ncbi:hypothetical protein ANO14919_088000 [Xylariales sp. No.14919]|nr:hypothetical protein ANO14919_088000 [Xylariales sp. No.14919]
MKLCQKCQGIFGDWEKHLDKQWQIIEYHDYFHDLQASAAGVCRFCELVLAGFSDHDILRMGNEKDCKLKARIGKFGDGNDLHRISPVFDCCTSDCGFREGRESTIYLSPSFDVKLRHFDPESIQDIIGSTGCRRNLDLAKTWLNQCVESHTRCQLQKPDTYPERLLSIRSGPLRLVLSSELPLRPKYATLSHCWGTTQQLKLEKNSFTEYRSQIPESKLSNTFTQAMVIAKHLEVNYLWIDSLCIIQDDPDDWAREAVKMCDVYGQSFINIAATSAEEGTKGCFFNRDDKTARKISNIRIPIQFDGNPFCYNCASARICNYGFDTSPLLSRAWVFQERFLAPRTLHFTDTQLFWECEDSRACETFPDGLPSLYKFERLRPNVTKHLSSNRAQVIMLFDPVQRMQEVMTEDDLAFGRFGLEGIQSLSDAWANTVHVYSRSKLTYVTDKLIALAGVAKYIQRQTNDEYLAGMWRNKLETQLLWQPIVSETTDAYYTARPPYLAPTWSWASTNRYVKYKSAFDINDYKDDAQKWSMHIKILGAHTDLVEASSPFGQVKGGEIRISFNLILSGCTRLPSTAPIKEQERDLASRIFGIDAMILRWDYPHEERSRIYFLPIISCCDKDDSELCFSEGIVLEEVGLEQSRRRRIFGAGLWYRNQSRPRKFRRVGYYYRNVCGTGRWYGEGGKDQDPGRFEEVMEGCKKRRTLSIV